MIKPLECPIASKPFDPDAFLARVHPLQERTKLPPLTDALLDEARARNDLDRHLLQPDRLPDCSAPIT
jgi:hypothetical protein